MIEIETCEQYESVLSLLCLLSKLQITKNIDVARQFIDDYSYDFARKECCYSPPADCYCDRDYPDYDRYSDDTSFEADFRNSDNKEEGGTK